MPAVPKQKILDTIDSLLQEGAGLLGTEWVKDRLGPWTIANPTSYVDLQSCYKWHAGIDNLMRMFGKLGEPWHKSLKDAGNTSSVVKKKVGTLQGIRSAVEGDLLITAEDLIRAELFDDLLEQADYLLSQNFYLAAGVLGRGVLEEHLRKWCGRAGCVPAKSKPTIADFTQELYKANVLNKLGMKHVEAMAAIGNDAAHNVQTLKRENVERLLRDLREFLVNTSP